MGLINIQQLFRGRKDDIVCSVLLLIIFLIVYLFVGTISLSFSQTTAVVINEIMYDPVQIDPCDDSRGEWVELKNPDLSSPLSMTNWSVKDATTTSRSFSGEISANGYALLVSNKTCFLQNHLGVSESLIIDLNAKIGSGLNNSNGTSGFADQVWIFDETGMQIAMVEYSDETAEGKSLALFGGSWEEANPTPGAENESPPSSEDPPEEVHPSVTFSALSSVSAGSGFPVTVNLQKFDLGTYRVKVLVGKGDSFIYGNTKSGSAWLTQNGAWAEMPGISVGSSGSASKAVQAKVDDDALAGSYRIKVRVNRDGDNYDSAEKVLTVKAASAVVSSSESAGSSDSGASGEPTAYSYETGENPAGEVLGESSSPDKSFQLNFYLIVGVFGLIVGVGGLVLVFNYRRNSSVAAR